MNIEWEFTNNDDMKMHPCMRLRGPQGKQGEQGIQGIQGEKGDTGSQGIQGETGKGLEYNWSGTQLGVRVEGDSAYTYTDLQGEKGDKGDTGATGAAAGFGTPTASITGTTGTPGVTVTASGSDTEKVFAFTFSNLKGDKGDTGNTGAAAGFGTPTASVDGTTGTPAVSVTASGSDTEKVFAFEFSGLKGETGQTGETGATGADGVSPEVTVATIAGGHRVTITDADHPSGQTFDVMDGSGSGDMSASVYDPQSAVATAGGIPDYVAAQGFASAGDLSAHTGNTSNPHSVTAAQVGLGNVDNTADATKSVLYAATAGAAPASDVSAWAKEANKPSYTASEVGLGNVPNVATNDQTPTYTAASSNTALSSGEKLSVAFGKLAKIVSSFISHLSASNPHGITASTVGLGNCDNTADANKSVSYAATAGSAPASDVYSWAKASSKPSYTASEVGAAASTHSHGSITSSGYIGSTSGVALVTTTSGQITTRSIKDNSGTSGTLGTNTYLMTERTLRYHSNRTTSAASADTSYTTYMFRGEALNSSDTNPSYNGQISWTYS